MVFVLVLSLFGFHFLLLCCAIFMVYFPMVPLPQCMVYPAFPSAQLTSRPRNPLTPTLAHTHTHARTRATHAHAHTHIDYTYSHTNTNINTHIQTYASICSGSVIVHKSHIAYACAHIRVLMHRYAAKERVYVYAHAYSKVTLHTHTHTYAYSCTDTPHKSVCTCIQHAHTAVLD